MIKNPLTMHPDADVETAAQIIYEKKIGGIPVVDDEDKPVAGVRISAYGRGQPNRNTITDETGKFQMEKMCEGNITISANTDSQPRLYGRVETEGGSQPARERGRPDLASLQSRCAQRGRPGKNRFEFRLSAQRQPVAAQGP